MLIVACNLPLGLTVRVNDRQTINLNGTNADVNPLEPGRNGVGMDTLNTINGYGITKLSDDDAAAFGDWSDRVLYRQDKDGKPAKDQGLLDEPFQPLLNGAIRTFKSEAEARKELSSAPVADTGMGGVDGDAEVKAAAAASGKGLVDSGTQRE